MGLAVYELYSDDDCDIELYADDMAHPSPKSSYLAALTIFSTIFNVDPEKVPVSMGISANHGKYLHKAAHNAIYKVPEVPAGY